MLVAVTSFGSAIIAALAVLGGVWLQGRQQQRGAEADVRESAYVDVLAASMGVARRVHTLLTTVQARSGLGEGLSVLLGLQQPLDARALQDWMDVDFGPLINAWTRVWTSGTPRGVELSNVVLDRCSEVLAVLQLDQPVTPSERVRRAVAGVKTDDLVAEWQRRLKQLATARRDLAELVRVETGRTPATLFAEI